MNESVLDLLERGANAMEARSPNASFGVFRLEASDLVGVGAFPDLSTLPFDVVAASLEAWRARLARRSADKEEMLADLDELAHQQRFEVGPEALLDGAQTSVGLSAFLEQLHRHPLSRATLEGRDLPAGPDVLIGMRALRRRRGERGAREHRLLADGIVESLAKMDAAEFNPGSGRLLMTALYLAVHPEIDLSLVDSDTVDIWIDDWVDNDPEQADEVLRRLVLAEQAAAGDGSIAVDLLVVEPEGWWPLPPQDWTVRADPAWVSDTVDLAVSQGETWIQADPDPRTRAELTELVSLAREGSPDAARQLISLMGERLILDTGGIRGEMGPGPGRLNRLTVRLISRAVAVLVGTTEWGGSGNQIVVARDARYHSDEFANEVVDELSGHGFDVLAFPAPVPTPVAVFAVPHLNAIGGVMVTASHNPAADNGVKVLGPSGGQLVGGIDTQLIDLVNHYVEAIAAGETLEFPSHMAPLPPMESVAKHLTDAYVAQVKSQIPLTEQAAAQLPLVSCVYSPLHGVAADLVSRVWREVSGHQLRVVESQSRPDGAFPGLPVPNPEDDAAFTEALALADSLSSDLVLLNDPDGDRLGVAVRHHGAWRILTGDEIGVLLADYLMLAQDPVNKLVVRALVCDSLVDQIAVSAGAEALLAGTGYRSIIKTAREFEREKPGSHFVFGYEPSLGYGFGQGVEDKDGIAASLAAGAAFAHWSDSGATLVDRLVQIWEKFGVHVAVQASKRLGSGIDATRMRSAMRGLVAGEPWLRDQDSDPTEQLAHLMNQAGAHIYMASIVASGTLKLESHLGIEGLVRMSGTEPKLKAYVFGRSQLGPGGDVAAEHRRLTELGRTFASEILDLVASNDAGTLR